MTEVLHDPIWSFCLKADVVIFFAGITFCVGAAFARPTWVWLKSTKDRLKEIVWG
jgi:hypothetical protein